jgi:HSP20 family protein
MQTIPTTQTETSTSRKPEPAKTRDPEPALRPVTPPLDLLESDGEILLLLDVPGVASEDVDIGFDRDVVHVAAKRRAVGIVFERAFDVPPDIDAAGIRAEFRDGVLELHFPKHAERARRTIAISGK